MIKQNISINGKIYKVEIDDTTSAPFKVNVDGVNFEVFVEPASDKLVVTKPELQTSAPQPAVPVVARTAPQAASTSDVGNEVVAPMPGTILDILVKVGDSITKGQEICSLEAMKMKNTIRSPRNGVVLSIEVTAGQKVKHNDLIMRIG